MSASLDRVLRAIDSGLQRTTEASYGTDTHPEMCARCQRVEPGDGDICAGCRAFLLGDEPEPATGGVIGGGPTPVETGQGTPMPPDPTSAMVVNIQRTARDLAAFWFVSLAEAQRRLAAALIPGGPQWPSAMRSSDLPPGHVWIWDEPALQWQIRLLADPFRAPMAIFTLEFVRRSTPEDIAWACARAAEVAWRTHGEQEAERLRDHVVRNQRHSGSIEFIEFLNVVSPREMAHQISIDRRTSATGQTGVHLQ